MVTLTCRCGESWTANRVAHIKDKYWKHIRNCKTHNGSFFYARKQNNMNSIFGDSFKSIAEVTEIHRSTSEALHTANLLAVYKTPNLCQYLTDTERIELEKTILQRTGLRNA